MALFGDIGSRVRRVTPLVLAAAIFFYFSYHAVHGAKGIKAWARLSEDLAAAKKEHAALVARRMELERRVNLLRRDHLDPDLLEERALKVLNYLRPDEFVIMLDER